MSSTTAMRFWPSRTAASIWIPLAAVYVFQGLYRYLHHRHDHSAIFMMVCWSCIMLIWAILISTSWTFTHDALVQRRALWKRIVPYQSIVSVDPSSIKSNRETAIIRYGSNGPITSEEKLVVNPHDYAGFLGELERHVSEDVMHV